MAISETQELALSGIRKTFGGVVAVDNCDLSIRRGEIVALLGASGCGKSTLLNIIAGFESPNAGRVTVRDQIINDIPPYRRNVAMVFQQYALFPHLTVAENISYGLKARRVDRREVAARVEEMLALLQLGGLATRYPAQLSGGQRQRVAVARALAIKPDILLLDEAFSALDRNLREDMQLELSLLLRKLSVTTVLVTHDQREAFALADRIAIMERGKIIQIDAPETVYRNPSNDYVLRFLGTTNTLPAVVEESRLIVEGGIICAIPESFPALKSGSRVNLDVRAEDVSLSSTPTDIHANSPGIVSLRTFLGAQERVVVDLHGRQIVVDLAARSSAAASSFAAGQDVYLTFDPARCRISLYD